MISRDPSLSLATAVTPLLAVGIPAGAAPGSSSPTDPGFAAFLAAVTAPRGNGAVAAPAAAGPEITGGGILPPPVPATGARPIPAGLLPIASQGFAQTALPTAHGATIRTAETAAAIAAPGAVTQGTDPLPLQPSPETAAKFAAAAQTATATVTRPATAPSSLATAAATPEAASAATPDAIAVAPAFGTAPPPASVAASPTSTPIPEAAPANRQATATVASSPAVAPTVPDAAALGWAHPSLLPADVGTRLPPVSPAAGLRSATAALPEMPTKTAAPPPHLAMGIETVMRDAALAEADDASTAPLAGRAMLSAASALVRLVPAAAETSASLVGGEPRAVTHASNPNPVRKPGLAGSDPALQSGPIAGLQADGPVAGLDPTRPPIAATPSATGAASARTAGLGGASAKLAAGPDTPGVLPDGALDELPSAGGTDAMSALRLVDDAPMARAATLDPAPAASPAPAAGLDGLVPSPAILAASMAAPAPPPAKGQAVDLPAAVARPAAEASAAAVPREGAGVSSGSGAVPSGSSPSHDPATSRFAEGLAPKASAPLPRTAADPAPARPAAALTPSMPRSHPIPADGAAASSTFVASAPAAPPATAPATAPAGAAAPAPLAHGRIADGDATPSSEMLVVATGVPSGQASPQGEARARINPVATYAAQLADQTIPDERKATVTAAPPVPSAPGDIARAPAFALPGDAGEAAAASASIALLADAPQIEPHRHADATTVQTAPGAGRSTAPDAGAMPHARPFAPAAPAQIAVSVARAVQDGVDRISIKLQPPELGRIDVRLDLGADGRVQAVLLAERPATLEMLQRDARELERALAGAGLDTGSGGLSFGLRSNGNGSGNAHGGGHGPAGDDRGGPSDDRAADTSSLPLQRPPQASGNGRLDIHV